MKVLLGYDGSACGDAAVEDLARCGLPDDTRVSILTAADVFLPPSGDAPAIPAAHVPGAVRSRELAEKAVAEAKAAAAKAADRVRAINPHWKVTFEAVADNPAWAIIKHADGWKPDLIVVGSHGHSAIRRLVLGSTSQKVLHHAPCSVRVSRSRPSGKTGPLKLMIGIDGSVDSATAVNAVAARKWPPGTEAVVAWVLDLRAMTAVIADIPYAATLAIDPEDGAHTRAMKATEQACEELRASRVAAVPFVEDGNARDVLVAEAERLGVDCVVLGAKGMTRIERFLLGSVSAAVAARAGCSVEVVRFPATS